MIIGCPKCETTFSLPDELFSPGKKARCSQCGNVFAMSAPADAEPAASSGGGETAPPAPEKQSFLKRWFTLIAATAAGLLLLLLVVGGYLIYSSFSSSTPTTAEEKAGEISGESPAQAADGAPSLLDGLSLDAIRYFFVDNKEIGRILVIQGEVINISQTNKDYIVVEAVLQNEHKHEVAKKFQYCGVPLTLFQLQNLSEKDLEDTLTNRLTILTNNTNIPPGGRVPFVTVFTTPPDSMRHFEVRVVDASDSPQE